MQPKFYMKVVESSQSSEQYPSQGNRYVVMTSVMMGVGVEEGCYLLVGCHLFLPPAVGCESSERVLQDGSVPEMINISLRLFTTYYFKLLHNFFSIITAQKGELFGYQENEMT